jgi:predicted nucleic acid-binding protein
MVMNAYFDTAIIIKLYVQEATSTDAIRLANECLSPYLLTPWQEIEARTALRLKAFRKEISIAEMQASLAAFEEDIQSGRWEKPEYSEAAVWRFARELSDNHAMKIGCRTLDILHVAAALCLGMETFVTFDERQRALAKLKGLTVKP